MTIFEAELSTNSRQIDLSGCTVHHVKGHEAISEPFSFEVDLVAALDGAPELEKLAGSLVSLRLRGRDRERILHGMIARARMRRDPRQGTASFRVVVVPRLWRSSLVTMQEIHQHLSVPEIIAKKLGNVNLAAGSDVEIQLSTRYGKRRFVVQWSESDLAFLSRLAEHEGISFIFVHGEDDTVRFVDDVAAFPMLREELVLRDDGTEEDVFSLERALELIPAYYQVNDYDDRRPEIDVRGDTTLDQGYAGAIISHGPHVTTPEAAQRLARIRAEEKLCERDVFEGRSNVVTLEAGRRVVVAGDGTNEALLVTRIDHEMHLGARGARASEDVYKNAFRAIPSAHAYRPARRTPVPRINGVLTGTIVTGPAIHERYAEIDDDGRYWVRFLFDPAPAERRPSVETRMLQAHTGPGYGIHFPLKPGAEVLVAFVNGDPDRPIIVGAAPNPRTPSPVTAGNGTQNRIVTRSGISFAFEDGVGQE